MNTKIRTAQGKYINPQDYIVGDEIAIGNMSTNARGDEIDKFGNVIKPIAAISADYHAAPSNTKIKNIPLSELKDDFFMTLSDIVDHNALASATPELTKESIKKKK